MKVAFGSALLSAFALQQATATFGWPGKGQCSDSERYSFDWSDLALGHFSSFRNFDFSGFVRKEFSLKDFFGKGKFKSNKAIEAKITKGVAGPSFSKKGGFFVKKFKLSVDVETDLEITYKLADGSKCKQVSRCRPGGTVIRNKRCGGAVSVDFDLSASVDIDFTFISIHHIDFDCDRDDDDDDDYDDDDDDDDHYSTKPTDKPTATPSPTSDYPATPSPTDSSDYPATPSPTDSSYPEPTVTSAPIYTTSTIYTTAYETVTSCPPSVPSCPAGGYPTVITRTIPISTTVCPVEPEPTTPPNPTYTTSTIYTTAYETVTSCPPSVPSCPAGGYPTVITKTIPISTTVCLVEPEPTAPLPNPSYPQPGYNTTIQVPPYTLSTSAYATGTVGPQPPEFTGAASSMTRGSMVFVAASLLLAGLAQL
ncbi:hypothetical protein GX50_06380 [[Emmonsia] crescens]|uniref:Uncharacterized protein n=1 Tax=[Emmonsia] crescens TaxID=73230 RepID=A0A2B7ZDD2_9EURO|nr:hypothetical protein GX50_06380 [Emmonsia crescens]